MQRSWQECLTIMQNQCKINAGFKQDIARIIQGTCKIHARFLQELSNNLARVIQQSCKNPPKSVQYSWLEWVIIVQDSCKNLSKILFQDPCQILARINQQLSKIHASILVRLSNDHPRFLQDSCKNYSRSSQDSCKNCVRIMLDPCKVYARLIKESCKIHARRLRIFFSNSKFYRWAGGFFFRYLCVRNDSSAFSKCEGLCRLKKMCTWHLPNSMWRETLYIVWSLVKTDSLRTCSGCCRNRVKTSGCLRYWQKTL